MPEYTAPGVYIEEIPGGPRPIDAAPTDVAAFVGATTRGPFNEPTAVESFADFVKVFGPPSTERPAAIAAMQFFANGGRKAIVVRVKRSDIRGGRPLSSKYAIGDANAGTGIHALRAAEPFGLLLTPDQAEMNVTEAGLLAKAALNYCEKHRVFYILDVPDLGWSRRSSVPAVVDWARRSADLRHPNAAVFFPRISMSDPSGRPAPVLVSPGGAVAGLYARIDGERGVWKAPAGVSASLHGVSETEIGLSADEAERLQTASVNAILAFGGRGIVVWGARTFVAGDLTTDWRYVPVRRLALSIENSIYKGISWAVFEPNGERLWAQIRLAISSFMNQLFRAGAFPGASAGEAYFVKCGRNTMTQDDIDSGRIVALIGFAPVRPAEFVILRIQQRISSAD